MKKREQQGRPDACGWLWQLWREGGGREGGESERERERVRERERERMYTCSNIGKLKFTQCTQHTTLKVATRKSQFFYKWR